MTHEHEALPAPRPLAAALAPLLLPVLPPPLIARAARLLLRRLGRANPALVAALAALPPARLAIVARELRTPLELAYGGGQLPTLRHVAPAARGLAAPPDATLAGGLTVLIDLLEGRIDGDALFFARTLTVTGDSAVVVALRNTLDRYEIDLMSLATGLLGPAASPARRLALRVERVARAARQRLAALHRALHEAESGGGPPVADALAALRAEQRRLAIRLTAVERRAARPGAGTS